MKFVFHDDYTFLTSQYITFIVAFGAALYQLPTLFLKHYVLMTGLHVNDDFL